MYKNDCLNLLIVDDHPMILEGLKSLLQQIGKYQLFSFTKGSASPVIIGFRLRMLVICCG